MNKLYVVTRKTCGFDEYKSHVVAAASKSEAKSEAASYDESILEKGWADAEVKKIGKTSLPKGVLHSNFKGG